MNKTCRFPSLDPSNAMVPGDAKEIRPLARLAT